MIHDCIPCQYGYHDEHIDVPGPVPKGLIGGWACECKGECRDRLQREVPVIDAEPMSAEVVAAMEFLSQAAEKAAPPRKDQT